MKLAPAALALLSLSALGLTGCVTPDNYGVDVLNKTGQLVEVTFLNVSSDGTTKPYSSTMLAKNGTCTAKVTHEEQGFGKRVRFSIPDRAADDPTSHVELKLSDERIRDYDLVIVNGRLVAREHTKGRPEYRAED
jgi:hypothetical protein